MSPHNSDTTWKKAVKDCFDEKRVKDKKNNSLLMDLYSIHFIDSEVDKEKPVKK